MSQSAAAPEKMRTKVKVAASTVICFSAARQSSELLANAIIASNVSMKTRVDFTTDEIRNRALREKPNRKPRDAPFPIVISDSQFSSGPGTTGHLVHRL